MKAVARVYWMFFTAFRIQRWLGVLGLIALAVGLSVGLVGALTDSEAVGGFPVGLLGFGVVVIFPAAFATGGILRALAASRANALLPRFRLRVLCAVALFVASIALLSYLVVSMNPTTGPPLGAELAVYAVGVLTAFVLSVVVITGNPNWGYLGFLAMLAPSTWTEVDGTRQLAAAGVSLPSIVAVATASAWLAFAIWYLRARHIRPVLLLTSTRGWTELWRSKERPVKRWPEDLTRGHAVGILLSGRVQRAFPHQLLIAAGAGALLCLVAPLLRYLPGAPSGTPPLTMFVWPFYAMFFVSLWAHQIARQSRHVWLRVPGPRAQVLKVVERTMARFFARVLTLITALVLVSVWVHGTPLNEAAWGIALMASAALYSACMGLASVRSTWLIAGGLLVMFIVQVVVLEVVQKPAETAQVVAAIGIQLAAACAFRVLAALRWRDIDWLKFRPQRFGRNEAR